MILKSLKQQWGFVRYYAFLIAAMLLLFYAGYEFSGHQNYRLQAKVELLQQSIDNLINDNQAINSALNVAKVELEVASIANEQMKESLHDSLRTENELRQQISFYQKVMAPELTQDGFVIDSLEIVPTPSVNNFLIKMMILQHQNIKSVIKGTIYATVFGNKDGKPMSLPLEQLQDDKQALKYSFKYFQVLETHITLPVGFNPERIELKTDVYKYKRKRGSYDKTIVWQEALLVE